MANAVLRSTSLPSSRIRSQTCNITDYSFQVILLILDAACTLECPFKSDSLHEAVAIKELPTSYPKDRFSWKAGGEEGEEPLHGEHICKRRLVACSCKDYSH